MKTIIDIHIAAKGKSGVRTMRKITDLPFAPSVGMEVEDGAWHETRKVAHVLLNMDEMLLYVLLELDEIGSSGNIDQHIQMYEAHGWKKPDLHD